MRQSTLFTYACIILTLTYCSCNDSPYMQGKRLYTANCQNCHMEDGSGLGKLIPPLKSSTLLGKPEMACTIKTGIRDTVFRDTTYLPREMPGFKKLSTTEITNIVNYINHTWFENFKEISILEIDKTLQNCK